MFSLLLLMIAQASDVVPVVGQRDQVMALRLDDAVPEGAEFILSHWVVDQTDPPLSAEHFGPLQMGVAGQPGDYRVVGLVVYQLEEIVGAEREFVITIEGARPPPDVPDTPDEPDEPEEPLEPAKHLGVVVYESLDQRAPIQLYEARRILNTRGAQLWFVDQDTVAGTGNVPEMIAPAIKAAHGAGQLPVLVVCRLDGEPIRAVKLPATADDVVREVER